MYNLIKSVINSGDYELSDMLKKIDTIWAQGDITDSQKEELVTLARDNAKPENTYAPLQEQIDELYARIKLLSVTVEANALGTAALKEAYPGGWKLIEDDIKTETEV